MNQQPFEEAVTPYKVGDKVIPWLHWPDRSSIHLMGHKIEGGQDPVQQLRSWLAAWMDTQKEVVDFGWQCYQDRCENAYVEASVVKRLEQENAALRKACNAMLECTGGSKHWNGETHEALKLIEEATSKAAEERMRG